MVALLHDDPKLKIVLNAGSWKPNPRKVIRNAAPVWGVGRANAVLDLTPARQMLKGVDKKHSKKIGATANYSPMAADGVHWQGRMRRKRSVPLIHWASCLATPCAFRRSCGKVASADFYGGTHA